MYTALRMDSVAKPTFNIVRDTREQPDLLDDALDLPSAINLFSCAGGWEGGGGRSFCARRGMLVW